MHDDYPEEPPIGLAAFNKAIDEKTYACCTGSGCEYCLNVSCRKVNHFPDIELVVYLEDE